jgi:hypothetical protein
MTLRILAFVLIVFTCAEKSVAALAGEPSKVKLVGPATVIAADPSKNQTDTVLTFKNDSTQPVTIVLTANPGQNSPVQVGFSAEKDTGAGADNFNLTVPASGEAKVRAVVRNADLKEAKFEIDDKSTSASLGTITVSRAPFSVKLDGSADKATLTLVKGQRTQIILRNDDDVPHALKWEISSQAYSICADKLTIPARSLGVLSCVPQWPRTSGYLQNLFRADASKGGYKLALYNDSSQIDPAAPAKIIQADAMLDYVDPVVRRAISTTVIIVVLTLGGICSLILNFLLPNRLLRLNIRERISALAHKTADLSTRIDSRLAVLLRLERSRLTELLKSRWTLSPDFAGVANQVSSGLTKLEMRLDLIQQMDAVLGGLEKVLPQGVAPSLIQNLEKDLRKTSLLLSNSDPTDEQIQTAKKTISDAAASVDTLTAPSSDFRADLLDKIKAFQATLTDIKDTNIFKRMILEVPGPNRQLVQVTSATTSLPAGSEALYDLALQQMKIVAEYSRQVENAKDERLKRLTDFEKALKDYLQKTSWSALESAQLLIREMGDNLYPDDLRQALLAGDTCISLDPAIAYDKAPLELSAHFTDSRLDTAAAKDEWSCNWNFGDRLVEKGWSVSHYYLLRGRKLSWWGRLKKWLSVKETAQEQAAKKEAAAKDPEAAALFEPFVTFIDENGRKIVGPDGKEAKISAIIPVRATEKQKIGERTTTELIKLVAALLIAVFGLLSGAQSQLDKLDVLPGLVAVFMLGFTADTIKNIISK